MNNPRRRVRFREIEAFVEVAESLNFSRAAEALHIAQSTLSGIIRALEQSLGTRLFDRNTRVVQLTPAGKEFLQLSRELMIEFDLTFQKFERFLHGKQGCLKIAASPSVMASFGPVVLRRFRMQHPNIEVLLSEKLYEDCIHALREREVEVVLTPRKLIASDLTQHNLFEDRLVMLCPSTHPLARLKTAQWAQIAKYDQIAMRPSSQVRQLIDSEYRRLGLTVTPIYEVDRVNSMIGFIEAGIGIGILPFSFLRVYNLSEVTFRHIQDERASRMICASHLSAATLSFGAERFIDTCQILSRQPEDTSSFHRHDP